MHISRNTVAKYCAGEAAEPNAHNNLLKFTGGQSIIYQPPQPEASVSFFSVHEHIAELLNEMMSEVRAETRKQLAGELRQAGVSSTEK